VDFRLHENQDAAAGEGAPQLVAGRYRIERQLGRGGMASVYEVVDVANERRLALKRLHPVTDPRKRKRSIQLFEREFHTLAQLAHPRVVEVFDYGVDDGGPYYTMELLDGGDLNQQAPVPWQHACSLARDICSALSLLHSRRMVYRDLSPRNVRCTSDGLAKLIDFGALLAMGPCRQVVGTPAYCSPEVLNLQLLDQRTDLYSLGATLYYTLVGRHAYPARDFATLREQWRARPLLPSEIVPGIPAALDGLVLDLMHLDPSGRPANAAEVMERLAAIEGRTLDENLLVPQSYLSTPTLVGRETSLSRARARIMRAVRGRGGALLIEGASGVGRSRLLEAALLEAKLSGALVVQADAVDGHSDYGAVRALADQLLEAAPDAALAAAQPAFGVLGHAVPALLARVEGAALHAFDGPEQVRAHVQQALREWLLAISRERALVVAIDDVHAIDEPSAAFVALLAHEVRHSSLLVAVTAEAGAQANSPSALKLLAAAASKITLDDLQLEATEQLLSSVFGDVPHVQMLAHRLHAIANGNPRDVMQLAQHLVDCGVVSYKAGAWSLPANVDQGDLPTNMAQALRARVDALSADAREFGRAMALCPERGVSLDEALSLSEHGQSARAIAALDELIQAQVVSLAGELYVIARRTWVPALCADTSDGDARRLHLKLAELFERRGDEGFRVAQHLLRAGEHERGLDALVAHAEQSQKLTDENADAFFKLLQSMPSDWFQCYQEAIALCESLGRPKRYAFTLRSRLAGIAAFMGTVDVTQQLALLDHLARESGLCDFDALDPAMEPMPRLVKALETAQARYAASSDFERVLDPVSAIRALGRAMIQSVAVAATSLDLELLRALPSLAPLLPLSPALGVVSMLAQGTGLRMAGHIEEARQIYVNLLDRAGQPDRAGLDETHQRYMTLGVMNGFGLLDASLGLDSSLAIAKTIEADPMYQVNALLIRMLYHLWQGNTREADKLRQRVDLIRIQSSPKQWFEGTHLLGQIVAGAAADDLTRTKQTLEEIDVLAQRYRAWVPVRHYALGEYQRIRGDHANALAAFDAALALMQPAGHQLWPNIAGARSRALFELGRHEQAREFAQASLHTAQSEGLGYVCNFIRMPLALACAKLGDAAAALAHAQAVIDGVTAIGGKGLLSVLAYETRACVAVYLGDQLAFNRHAALCAEQLRAASSQLLTAKYEKLRMVARRTETRLDSLMLETIEQTEQFTGSELTSLLDGCSGTHERAQQALTILLRHSGASDGFLYTLGERGPELVAQVGSHEIPSRMASMVRDFLDVELRDEDVQTAAVSPAEISGSLGPEWTASQGERFRFVLLAHPSPAGHAITGVAVALVQSGRAFAYPGPTAIQLSRILQDNGDAVPAIVAPR
jgi:tetratricopeptide (TPR) repeat protein